MTKHTLDGAGYSHEDEYFYKLNRELIEKRRIALNEEKKALEARENQKAHWMVCPKCGSQMNEVEMSGIKVDRCSGCKGTFFDNGELDTLLASKEPGSFLSRLSKAFK